MTDPDAATTARMDILAKANRQTIVTAITTKPLSQGGAEGGVSWRDIRLSKKENRTTANVKQAHKEGKISGYGDRCCNDRCIVP